MTYWRIQDPGLHLSKSHRSATHSLDDDDPGEIHAGTSVTRSISELGRMGPNLHGFPGSEVDLIELEGDEVGRGWDGEPVVIPTRELKRFRTTLPRDGFVGLRMNTLRDERDLIAAGWRRVRRFKVKE
jgi:hypothetical protein